MHHIIGFVLLPVVNGWCLPTDVDGKALSPQWELRHVKQGIEASLPHERGCLLDKLTVYILDPREKCTPLSISIQRTAEQLGKMFLLLLGCFLLFTIVYSFPQYSNPNPLAEMLYLPSSSSQGAYFNADPQGTSDSIQMNSQQWDMRPPSVFDPTKLSSENPGSSTLSASTLENSSGTQPFNAGNGLFTQAATSPESGTATANTLDLDGDPINETFDFLGNIPFTISSSGIGGGSQSPPEYSSSEASDTKSPHESPISPFSHFTPLILAQNNQATPIKSGDTANAHPSILTPDRHSADQALVDGDSPLPAIPFTDILHDVFTNPSFDTPRDLPEIDKVPGQQPLYDPEERMANPKRPDCEDGTYAMCCSLGPPRLPRTTPAVQVLLTKRMCQICKLVVIESHSPPLHWVSFSVPQPHFPK